jgi:hypothetical protein
MRVRVMLPSGCARITLKLGNRYGDTGPRIKDQWGFQLKSFPRAPRDKSGLDFQGNRMTC